MNKKWFAKNCFVGQTSKTLLVIPINPYLILKPAGFESALGLKFLFKSIPDTISMCLGNFKKTAEVGEDDFKPFFALFKILVFNQFFHSERGAG